MNTTQNLELKKIHIIEELREGKIAIAIAIVCALSTNCLSLILEGSATDEYYFNNDVNVLIDLFVSI